MHPPGLHLYKMGLYRRYVLTGQAGFGCEDSSRRGRTEKVKGKLSSKNRCLSEIGHFLRFHQILPETILYDGGKIGG